VDPQRRTETFAEIRLELDNWRWAGTIFRLRTGKALCRARKEVAVRFRPVPHLPFEHQGQARSNALRFGLEPESVALELSGTGPRSGTLVRSPSQPISNRPSCRPTRAASRHSHEELRFVDPSRRGRGVLARGHADF
jgi:glucose-6-phosphate 1-dehydrogenase